MSGNKIEWHGQKLNCFSIGLYWGNKFSTQQKILDKFNATNFFFSSITWFCFHPIYKYLRNFCAKFRPFWDEGQQFYSPPSFSSGNYTASFIRNSAKNKNPVSMICRKVPKLLGSDISVLSLKGFVCWMVLKTFFILFSLWFQFSVSLTNITAIHSINAIF